MISRFRDWCRQPDVRANLIRALWRRLRWRWHWSSPGAPPLHVANWWRGCCLDLAYSGSSAVAFYRDFNADPIVLGMERLVRPGSTVLDVGAHAGAYSIVAGRFTGAGGRVIAMEPQPALAALVRRNAEANAMPQILVEECAVGASAGEVAFSSDAHSQGGWIACAQKGTSTFVVPAVTLDGIWERKGEIGFVKLDAAGFELPAIKGGLRMLAASNAPDLAVKFYHPSIVESRCGGAGDDQQAALEELGYSLFEFIDGRWQPFARSLSEYSVAVLATRRPDALIS